MKLGKMSEVMEGLYFVILVTDLISHNTGKDNDIDSNSDGSDVKYDGLHKFSKPHFSPCAESTSIFISNLLLTCKSGVDLQLKLAF
jgi:hypothetical protein